MSASNNPSKPLRPKQKPVPTKNANNEAYERPTKKARPQRVMSEDEEEESMAENGIDEVVEVDVHGNEEEESMAENGIDEVVEVDVHGNEKPGSRHAVRLPSPEPSSPVHELATKRTKTDEEELGTFL
jgi:hypothetical protein